VERRDNSIDLAYSRRRKQEREPPFPLSLRVVFCLDMDDVSLPSSYSDDDYSWMEMPSGSSSDPNSPRVVVPREEEQGDSSPEEEDWMSIPHGPNYEGTNEVNERDDDANTDNDLPVAETVHEQESESGPSAEEREEGVAEENQIHGEEIQIENAEINQTDQKVEEKCMDLNTINLLVTHLRDVEKSRTEERMKKDKELVSMKKKLKKLTKEKDAIANQLSIQESTLKDREIEIEQLKKDKDEYKQLNEEQRRKRIAELDRLLTSDSSSDSSPDTDQIESGHRRVTLRNEKGGFFGFSYSGTTITRVSPGSSAAIHGLRVGDRLISINGVKVLENEKVTTQNLFRNAREVGRVTVTVQKCDESRNRNTEKKCIVG
ncbi:hypothetical protein PMAYCL1PPCAC_11698, partial [Pristionchus mayeri]